MEKNALEQSSDRRYLEKLEFRPILRKTWLNFFVVNFRVVILLIILLSSWGIFSFFQLPRESNPEVKIPFAVVSAVFPGASAVDVEELVTKKLETAIAGVKGVKKITSTSANSFSAISVEFNTSEDQTEALRNLKDKIALVEDLPEEVDSPSVNEVSFDDRPVLTVSLSGPFDGLTLRDYAEKIQDDLEKVPGVRKVNISGGDEKEFEIAYDSEKLAILGISLAQANQAVASANLAVPAGNFEGENYVYSVRTDGRFFESWELEKVPVWHTSEGAVVYLKDVAVVRERVIKKTIYSRSSIAGQSAQSAVTIDVVKKTGSSIISTVDQSKKIIEEKVAGFSSNLKYDTSVDYSKYIRQDFDQLTHDFILTLLLVFGVLFLIVGLKEAIVAGLAIPLVFFATFGVMLLTGTSLNFLSLFSLLLSLGLLVDDAIVVVSATKQYLRTGKFTPEEAVLLVLNDFKVVLLSTTLATTWAFLPLLLSTGIMGEFIKSIPITVSVTLISSLLIALMINHPLAAVLERIRLTRRLLLVYLVGLLLVGGVLFLQKTWWGYGGAVLMLAGVWRILFWYEKKGGQKKLIFNEELSDKEWKDDDLIKEKLKKQGQQQEEDFLSRLIHGIVHFDRLVPVYEKYARRVLTKKKRRIGLLLVSLGLFLLAVALPVFGIVTTEFFPASDQENIYITFELPIGRKLEATNALAEKIEEHLLKYPEIANFSTVVGRQGASTRSDGVAGSNDVSHLGGIVIKLKDKKERQVTSYALAEIIRDDLADLDQAVIMVESPSGGPPSGAVFEARIVGDDLQVLEKIVSDFQPILGSIEGVVDVDISLKEAPAEYTFVLDQERLELHGLNAGVVGATVRTVVSGTKISTIIKNNQELEVRAVFQEDKIANLKDLENLQLINSLGKAVSLSEVAKIELKPAVGSITRIDQKRAVLLSAGTDGTANSNQIVAEFQKKIEKYSWPEGYSVFYGGENEQNTESVLSIMRAMIIAGVLIISTLVIQFNSFRKALIVLVTLPLALIGVFFGMAVFGVTLSFPGLIGILALFGIVVKNAIILIDKINLNLKSEIPFFEAVVDAGKARLEAIFITSICTILGIIPVTLSNETWMALGSAVIFGLIFSSFLTLFVVPALFLTFVKEK